MRRVVKVGGSLLLRPDLVADIDGWLDRQTDARNFFVVGGGAMIDAVRELDRLHGFDPSSTHWRCVELLRATFEMVSELFPRWDRIESLTEDGLAGPYPSSAVVLPSCFYHRQSNNHPLGAVIPEDWRTTTDTIAAILAHQINADELVLLKSCPVQPEASPTDLAKMEIVDAAFVSASARLRRVRVQRLPSHLDRQAVT